MDGALELTIDITQNSLSTDALARRRTGSQ